MRGGAGMPPHASIQNDRVATFLLKKSPFTPEELLQLRTLADRLQFRILYAPGSEGPIAPAAGEWVEGTETAAYANLIVAPDREAVHELRAGHPADDR